MKIALIAEGKTERVFLEPLRRFLSFRLPNRMPRISCITYDGRIPTGDKLQRLVRRLLGENDAVIALTDVYTGTRAFTDAADAKAKMRGWVGSQQGFYPHAAQYDFEAWLLPYWDEIQRLSGSNPNSARARSRIRESHVAARSPDRRGLYGGHQTNLLQQTAGRSAHPRGPRSVGRCCSVRELKAFLNTLLTLCGGQPIG